MASMDNVGDILVVQRLVAALAPEVDQSPWARIQPLGMRWLVRSAAAQLQTAAAGAAGGNHRGGKRKRGGKRHMGS